MLFTSNVAAQKLDSAGAELKQAVVAKSISIGLTGISALLVKSVVKAKATGNYSGAEPLLYVASIAAAVCEVAALVHEYRAGKYLIK